MPLITFPDGSVIDSGTGMAPPAQPTPEEIARQERRRQQRAERERRRQQQIGRERYTMDFQSGPGQFDVGYGGNKGPDWGGTFGKLEGIGAPNLGEITQQQFEAAMADFDKEIGRSIGPERFGAFGQSILGKAMNPQGFGDAIMKRIIARLAEREAGVRASGQNDLSNLMARGGLAGNTSAAESLRQSLVGQSSSRLSSAELDAEIENAKLMAAREAAAINAAVGLTGYDADLAKTAALFKGGIPRPLTGGGGLQPDGSLMGAGGAPLVYPDGKINVGDPRNRLPGESLADQIRREAGERAAAGQGTSYGQY